MHLSASGNSYDPITSIWNLIQHIADRGSHTVPPIRRTLFRPAKLWHDLLVFTSGNDHDIATTIHEGSAHAARSDVNCK
jgi:hypothetical protein